MALSNWMILKVRKIENWYFELFKIFASLAIMNALNHFILLDYSSLLKKDSLLN